MKGQELLEKGPVFHQEVASRMKESVQQEPEEPEHGKLYSRFPAQPALRRFVEITLGPSFGAWQLK
jgi:hypothetical protein